jgi:Fur family transcriptional regulator, ferric uptake regulator
MPVDAQAPAAQAVGQVIENAVARLRQHGTRVTPARRLLLAALAAHPGHRTARQLAADVRAKAPDVNLSTIYRNLDELERLQVIDRTCTGDGPATYHLGTADHGHLACRHCGTITEVPGQLFAALADAARARYGFTVDPHSAVLGLCAACQ